MDRRLPEESPVLRAKREKENVKMLRLRFWMNNLKKEQGQNSRFRREKLTLSLVTIALLAIGCSVVSRSPQSTRPRLVTGDEVSQAIDRVPSEIGLSISGLLFFKGDLYATSNSGLLRIAQNGNRHLLSWTEYDDVVEGPWFDRSNDQLWVYHAGVSQLYRFDGREWNAVKIPVEELSRGDSIYGFDGLSSVKGFWLQARTRSCWQWNSASHNWALIDVPEVPCMDYSDGNDTYSCLASVGPVGDSIFVIMHREFIGPMANLEDSRAKRPQPDRVFLREGSKWKEVSQTNDPDFVTKRLVTSDKYAYVQSHFGSVFRVDRDGVENLGSPGAIGSMTIASDGALIVSVPHKGIFEYRDGWLKLFDPPYPDNYPVQFEYLAEQSGRIAYSAVPALSSFKRGEGFRSQIWVTEGNELIDVQIR